ncbi:acyltransferase family protein [Saccharicrinis sp. GN24d3]|uniref:acyltransferase family protein n=1 Tax=Saccharicrinis sp. GN24d3 TaxID=3458416 RepID=UPI00403514B2
MPNKPKTITYFENFDALRFISAIAVLLMHKFNNFNWEYFSDYPLVYRGLSFLTRNGFVGVNFFFVLSGFLITYLIIKEVELKNTFNYYHFVLRRVLRIWPVYFIVLFIGFFHKSEWQGLAYYLSFLSNIEVIYRNALQTGIQFPLWSVSIEEQFYIVIPLIIFLLKIKSKQGFFNLYLSLIAISTIYQILNYEDINKLRYSTLSCVTDLSVGGILGTLSFFSNRMVENLKNMPKWLIATIHFLGITFIVGRVYAYHIPFTLISEHLILALYFGFILMEQTFSTHSILKLKRFRTISRWGQYTYGLYLYHMVVLVAVHHYWQYFQFYDNIIIDTLGKLIISIAFSLILCWFSFKYIETPFLNLKKKFK